MKPVVRFLETKQRAMPYLGTAFDLADHFAGLHAQLRQLRLDGVQGLDGVIQQVTQMRLDSQTKIAALAETNPVAGILLADTAKR